MNAGDCLFNLVSKIGYFDRLKIIKTDDAQDRIDNVNELIINATESKNSVEDYLQSVSLITSADSDNKTGVCLSSIHAAKGKEWDLGILVSVNHGILPHGRSILEAKTLEEKRNWLEEETRIAFVAMTRFRKRLTVCYCNSRKYRDKSGMLRYKEDYPSQFLFESGLLKDKSKIKEGIFFKR
jgi:DNA helicase-2/ATP-dependent DNA helicase PcrA